MKKILCSLLASSMIVSGSLLGTNAAIISYDASENETVASKTIDEPTPEMMEEMIKKVRPLIVVPEEYTEFGWDFHGNSSHSESYWSFYWTDEKNGEISITCDTKGRITGYDVYNYNRNRNAVLPTESPEEILPVAEEFIKNTLPHLDGFDLRLTETAYPSVSYNHCYTFTFTRYENNIAVPQNTLRISVNHITKEVEALSTSINLDTVFKKSDNLISEDKAKELLASKQTMNLSYRLKNEYDDDGNLLERKAYLVYTPALSYISVDAQSGEIYDERTTWEALKAPGTNGSLAGGVLMDSMSKEESAESERGYQLTEEELKQLDVLAGLISKDEASDIIFNDPDLYLPEHAFLSEARLTKRYNMPRPLYAVNAEGTTEQDKDDEKYVWNLHFSTPGEMYLGANATVDAKDGFIISFRSDLPYTYHYEEFGLQLPEIRYTAEQAEKTASEFIKKHQPEKYKDIVLSNTFPYSVYKYVEGTDGNSIPYHRATELNFVRQNEGVDFTYNYFTLGVDRATGKITRYSYTWYDNISFESPKDAITEGDALLSLYTNNGFGINYEINRKYTYIEGVYNSTNSEIYSRAVYSLYNPVTTTVRAIDGKLINYNGDEVSEKKNTISYTDMDNHWAKETVERFSYIGYSSGCDKFEPNKAITGKDFVQLCEYIGIYGNSTEAEQLDSLTRMQAVKLITDYLGYGKVAALKNVFITDFADNSDFKSDDIGYAAIARGFGLIEGDGNNFRPYDTLTRAEALTIIENTIDLGVLNP